MCKETWMVCWGRYCQQERADSTLERLLTALQPSPLLSHICQTDENLRPWGRVKSKAPVSSPSARHYRKTSLPPFLKPFSGLLILSCFPQRASLWSHQPWVQMSKQCGLQTPPGWLSRREWATWSPFLVWVLWKLHKLSLSLVVLGKLQASSLHSTQSGGTSDYGCHTFLVPLPVLSGRSLTCCPWGCRATTDINGLSSSLLCFDHLSPISRHVTSICNPGYQSPNIHAVYHPPYSLPPVRSAPTSWWNPTFSGRQSTQGWELIFQEQLMIIPW